MSRCKDVNQLFIKNDSECCDKITHVVWTEVLNCPLTTVHECQESNVKKNAPFYLLHSDAETIIKLTFYMKNLTINKTKCARWRNALEEGITDERGGGGGRF